MTTNAIVAFGTAEHATLPRMECLVRRVKRRETCRPQTKETKRLVLPENRNRGRRLWSQQDPPCRRCFQRISNVISLVHAAHVKAARKQLRCNWNLEGAKGIQLHRKKKEGVKRDGKRNSDSYQFPRTEMLSMCKKNSM